MKEEIKKAVKERLISQERWDFLLEWVYIINKSLK